VLIVDSDAMTRSELRELLSEAGFDVMTAGRFEQGKQLLLAESPNLLIAEGRLGEFNGLQYVAVSQGRIPTIIISGSHAGGFEADAHQLGARFLAKPIVPSALLTLAQQMLAFAAVRPGLRRWARKPVTAVLPTRVNQQPARTINVSRRGLCVEIERQLLTIPRTFDVSFPTAGVSIRADAVWTRGGDLGWLCGAEVCVVDDPWLSFVEAIF
jgi:DNA-binding response OmpR family regulator